MSRRTAKERDATKLATAITRNKPVFMNRFVGLSVISECETQLYVLSLVSQLSNYEGTAKKIEPVLVAEGDYIWVHVGALRKNSYDRNLLKRTMRKLGDYSAVTAPVMHVVAQYGATGIVLDLPVAAYDRKRYLDPNTKIGPTWWADTQIMLSYNKR